MRYNAGDRAIATRHPSGEVVGWSCIMDAYDGKPVIIITDAGSRIYAMPVDMDFQKYEEARHYKERGYCYDRNCITPIQQLDVELIL